MTPASYSVSWHCLAFTFARGTSHHFSPDCHALSKGAFFTNQKSLRDTNQDTHKTKSTYTPVAYGIKQESPPNKFISRYKWQYTQIHNSEHCIHIFWGIFCPPKPSCNCSIEILLLVTTQWLSSTFIWAESTTNSVSLSSALSRNLSSAVAHSPEALFAD